MYKISIPVVISTEQFKMEETLSELKRAGADRVMLAVGEIPFHRETRRVILDKLAKCVPYYKEHGLEVGFWAWSFMRADRHNDPWGCDIRIGHDGVENPVAYCPLSPGFVADTQEFVTEIARLGVDIIQFDDDYSMTFSGGKKDHCYCDRHMELIRKELGEEIDRETLFEKAFSGKANRYRDAVMKVSGDSLLWFSRKVREAVDAVNPAIRISLCSVMCAWDMDGTNAIETAKTLAGDTKPLIRMINAPYWCVSKAWGNRLGHTVELGRMQSAWCDGQGIELMSEGDVYPRPRHYVPASYLEGYDAMSRFGGGTDGILKYMLDYNSSPTYETGYIDKHLKHQPLYDRLAKEYARGSAVGVRVYNAMTKFREADFTGVEDVMEYGWNTFFSRAARVLVDNAIPATYHGTGLCGIAFGENARHLPQEALDHGLILDIRGAKILTEMGVDVGRDGVGECIAPRRTPSGCATPQFLYYPAEDEYTVTGYGPKSAYEVKPREGAEVIATVRDELGEKIESYRYVNAAGQKFVVYGFDAYFTEEGRYRSSAMQRQLTDAVEWLSGEKLPVSCMGHPDLYIQAKRDGDTLLVGMWNTFADAIDQPVVKMDRAYGKAEVLNGTGVLSGDSLTLSTLQPFDVVFFKLS